MADVISVEEHTRGRKIELATFGNNSQTGSGSLFEEKDFDLMYKLGQLENHEQNQDVSQVNRDVFTGHNMNHSSCSLSSPTSDASGSKATTTSVLRRWRRPDTHDSSTKHVQSKDPATQPSKMNQVGNFSTSATGSDYSMYVPQLSPLVPQSTARPYDSTKYLYSENSKLPDKGQTQYYQDGTNQEVHFRSPSYPVQNTPPLAHSASQKCVLPNENTTYPVAQKVNREYGYPHRDYSVVAHNYSPQKINPAESKLPQEDPNYCLTKPYVQDNRISPQNMTHSYPLQNAIDRRVSPQNPKSPIYRNYHQNASGVINVPQQNYVSPSKTSEYPAQNSYYMEKPPCNQKQDARYVQNYNQNYMSKNPMVNSQDPKHARDYRTLTSNSKKPSPPFPILEQRLNQADANYCADYSTQGYYPSKYGPVVYSRTSPTPKTVNNYVHHNHKIPSQDVMVPPNYSFPNKFYQQNQQPKEYEQNLYLSQMNQMHARLPHNTSKSTDLPRDLSYVDQTQRLVQKGRMYCPEASPVEHLQYTGKSVVPVTQKSPKMVTYTGENDYLNLSRPCGTVVNQGPSKVGEYGPVIRTAKAAELGYDPKLSRDYIMHQQACRNDVSEQQNYCSPSSIGQNSRNPPPYPVGYSRQSNIKMNEMPARNISPRRTFQENMPVVVFSPQHIGLPKASPGQIYPPEYSQHYLNSGYYPREQVYPSGVKPGMPQYPIDQTGKYPNVHINRNVPQHRLHYGYPEHQYYQHKHPEQADNLNYYQGNMYRTHYQNLPEHLQQTTRAFEVDYRGASNYDFEVNRIDDRTVFGKKEDIGKSLKEFLESWEDDEEIVANLPDLVLCNNIQPEKQKQSFASEEGSKSSTSSPESSKSTEEGSNQPLYILGSTNISSEALPEYLAVYEQVDKLPDNIKGFYKGPPPNSNEEGQTTAPKSVEKSPEHAETPQDSVIQESLSPHDLTVNKIREEDKMVQEEEVLNLSTNRNKENDEFLVEEYSNTSEESRSVSENQDQDTEKETSSTHTSSESENSPQEVDKIVEPIEISSENSILAEKSVETPEERVNDSVEEDSKNPEENVEDTVKNISEDSENCEQCIIVCHIRENDATKFIKSDSENDKSSDEDEREKKRPKIVAGNIGSTSVIVPNTFFDNAALLNKIDSLVKLPPPSESPTDTLQNQDDDRLLGTTEILSELPEKYIDPAIIINKIDLLVKLPESEDPMETVIEEYDDKLSATTEILSEIPVDSSSTFSENILTEKTLEIVETDKSKLDEIVDEIETSKTIDESPKDISEQEKNNLDLDIDAIDFETVELISESKDNLENGDENEEIKDNNEVTDDNNKVTEDNHRANEDNHKPNEDTHEEIEPISFENLINSPENIEMKDDEDSISRDFETNTENLSKDEVKLVEDKHCSEEDTSPSIPMETDLSLSINKCGPEEIPLIKDLIETTEKAPESNSEMKETEVLEEREEVVENESEDIDQSNLVEFDHSENNELPIIKDNDCEIISKPANVVLNDSEKNEEEKITKLSENLEPISSKDNENSNEENDCNIEPELSSLLLVDNSDKIEKIQVVNVPASIEQKTTKVDEKHSEKIKDKVEENNLDNLEHSEEIKDKVEENNLDNSEKKDSTSVYTSVPYISVNLDYEIVDYEDEKCDIKDESLDINSPPPDNINNEVFKEESSTNSQDNSEDKTQSEPECTNKEVKEQMEEELVIKEEVIDDPPENEETQEFEMPFESSVDKLIITNVKTIQEDSSDSITQEETSNESSFEAKEDIKNGDASVEDEMKVEDNIECIKSDEESIPHEYAHLIEIDDIEKEEMKSTDESNESINHRQELSKKTKENLGPTDPKNEDSSNFDFSYLESCTDNICEKEDKNLTNTNKSSKSNHQHCNNDNLKSILDSSESDSDVSKDTETKVKETLVNNTNNNETVNETKDDSKNNNNNKGNVETEESNKSEEDVVDSVPEISQSPVTESMNDPKYNEKDSQNVEDHVDILQESKKDLVIPETIEVPETDLTIPEALISEAEINEDISEIHLKSPDHTSVPENCPEMVDNMTEIVETTAEIVESIPEISDALNEVSTTDIDERSSEIIESNSKTVESSTENIPLVCLEENIDVNFNDTVIVTDNESLEENIILPEDSECVVIYEEDEQYLIIQPDTDTAEIDSSGEIIVDDTEILIPEIPAEVQPHKEEEILVNEPVGEEIIICEEGIEDWVQNEEIIESHEEDSDNNGRKQEETIEETENYIENDLKVLADELKPKENKEETEIKLMKKKKYSLEKKQLLIAKKKELLMMKRKKKLEKFKKQKLLDPKHITEIFINEEKRYSYPNSELENNVEEKELFINPENPITNKHNNNSSNYSFPDSICVIKRRVSYGDFSSPKIDFKAPKRRYSTMETDRSVKKPIINLDEISKNITEVLENFTKQETLQYKNLDKIRIGFKMKLKKEDNTKFIDKEVNEEIKLNLKDVNNRKKCRPEIQVETKNLNKQENKFDINKKSLGNEVTKVEINNSSKDSCPKITSPTNGVIKLVEKIIKPKLVIPKTNLSEIKLNPEQPTIPKRRPSLLKTPEIKEDNNIFDNSSPVLNTARLTEPIFAKSSTVAYKSPNVDPRIDRPKEVSEKEEKREEKTSLIENKLSNTFSLTEYTKNYIKMKTGHTVGSKNISGINGSKNVIPRLTKSPKDHKHEGKINNTRKKHQTINKDDHKDSEKKVKINLQDYRNRKQSLSSTDSNVFSPEHSISSPIEDDIKKDSKYRKEENLEERSVEPKYKDKENKRKSMEDTIRKVEKLKIKPKQYFDSVTKDPLLSPEVTIVTNPEEPKVTNITNKIDCNNLVIENNVSSEAMKEQNKPKKRKRRFRNLYTVDEEDEVPNKQCKNSLNTIKPNGILNTNDDSTSSSKTCEDNSANSSSGSKSEDSETSVVSSASNGEFLYCLDLNSNGTNDNNCGFKCHIKLNAIGEKIRDYEINKNCNPDRLKLTLKPVKKKKPAFSEVLSNLDSLVKSELLSKKLKKRPDDKNISDKSEKNGDDTLWTIKNKVPKVIIKRNGSGYCAVFRDVSSNPIWQPKIRLKRQKFIESLVLRNNVKF